MVKHIIPKTYQDALKYLAEGTYQVIAGGTDLMIQQRNWAELPPTFTRNVLYILNLKELHYVIKESDCIRIGAMTPLEVLLDDPKTPGLIKEVILEMAGPGLRQVATLAGNIGNASPAGDSLVPLYLMNASVVLESLDTTRTLPIEAVISGPRQTCINANEMIKEIIIPTPAFTHTRWTKVGGRRADAISKVSFCGAAIIENAVVKDLRIALGSVFKTIIRDRDIEHTCLNQPLSELKANLDHILERYDPLIQPIDDQRSNKTYRKKVALNMIRSFINDL